ncbi:MAG: hypothetical protein M0D55_15495 [Elusimicrobiota bacterium]|nr:MAG: hypothetical protein M0D55_15495 [Elusimicrobiota bacterium]
MRLAAALLLALASCRKAPESPAGCVQDPGFDRSASFRVHAEAPAAVLRRDLGLAALGREAGNASERPQGLTKVDHQVRFRSRLRVEETRGGACAWFEEAVVDLTPRSVEIFVPSDYADGSCEYEAILAHEREHERVHAERLAAGARGVSEALAAAAWLPAKGNPAASAGKAEAETELDAKLRRAVMPAVALYKEDLRAAQAELDAPGLYQWTSKRCSGWK